MEKQKGGAPAKRFSARKARTYAEQIELIRKKGFVVDDENECASLLRKVNYTRLAAYFRPFRRENGTNSLNVNFHKIRGIYEFDGKMRAVLFECIGEIECYLRGQFAYFSGHQHGAYGYLEEGTFSDKHNQDQFLKRVGQCLDNNKRLLIEEYSDEESGGKFPIWIIVEFFTTGTLSYFYRDLKSKDQKALAKEMYKTYPKCLTSWLICLVKLRNRCAHHSRLYDWSFASLPEMPDKITYTPEYKLFTQIMNLKLLYPEPEKWNSTTLAKIEALLAEYRDEISLEHIGFPKNWKAILQSTERE